MTEDEFTQHKQIEFYASSVDAWFASSLEHDRSVLALSAAGIGLLLTLLTTVGLSSVWALVLYILSLACFVIALVTILFVFRRNRSYIEQVVTGTASKSDPALSSADTIALFAFGLGVALAAIIGIATAVQSYTSKEASMSNEPKTTAQPAPLRESSNGASNLRPTAVNKSFNGAANLAPQTQPPSATPAAPAAPPPAASTTQSSQAPAPSAPASSQASGGSGA